MRKKILLLSDDIRMMSGVATMARELVLGTVHKFDWVNLGAGINHPDVGKTFVMDEDAKKISGNPNATIKIIPNNGYGDIPTIRRLIDLEKIDGILCFTDPHYWTWLFDGEHEIRQQVPLMYYHVWDDLPSPQYNRNYYESCDWIGCISKQTYGIVHRVGKRNDIHTFKPLHDWQISYVPHGINPDVFKPIDRISDEIYDLAHKDKQRDFVLFFNNRNIRRKQPADIIYSYKLFCDQLPKDKADKCLLLMHTSAIDDNGTDLVAVKNDLCPNYDVTFTTKKYDQNKLNELYNLADCTINLANNEGFGLGTAESIMAGTPIIVNVTGGLQDQCGFPYTADDYIKIESLHHKKTYENTPHGEWAFPVWPSSITINGSPLTPYIFDDRVNDDIVADTILKVYNIGHQKREEYGLLGREFAKANLSAAYMCQTFIDGVEATFKNYIPKEKFNLYKIR